MTGSGPDGAASVRITAQTRAMLRELVRTSIRERTRELVDREIAAIRRQEAERWAQVELAEVVRVALAGRIRPIARQLAREMVVTALPAIAERLVVEEIARIRETD